jgi:hypothetical protein
MGHNLPLNTLHACLQKIIFLSSNLFKLQKKKKKSYSQQINWREWE